MFQSYGVRKSKKNVLAKMEAISSNSTISTGGGLGAPPPWQLGLQNTSMSFYLSYRKLNNIFKIYNRSGGHFACHCNEGYRIGGDGRSCQEVDSCRRNNGGCQHECVNHRGEARCRFVRVKKHRDCVLGRGGGYSQIPYACGNKWQKIFLRRKFLKENWFFENLTYLNGDLMLDPIKMIKMIKIIKMIFLCN